MNTLKDWLIIVPARLKSERLPRKPLVTLGGKTLLEQVYNNLKPLTLEGAHIVVAVDSDEVADACATKQIPWIMTSTSHQSGTDRCNEVAQQFKHQWIMNVQGDEPFVDLDDLRTLAKTMMSSGRPMATLGFAADNQEHFQDPNCVKIVLASSGVALYFSRAGVPFDRDAHRGRQHQSRFWQHLGVYAFTKASLNAFCKLPESPLEQLEMLEQLRAVEAGWQIQVATAKTKGFGIDTQDDLERAEQHLLAQL